MNALVWTGSILALLTYYPLWKQIKSGKAKQNFLTWALFCTGLFCLKNSIVQHLILDEFEPLLPIATYPPNQPAEGVPFYKISNILERGHPAVMHGGCVNFLDGAKRPI